MIVKAVSLWEPWASLMALGAKTIETRDRKVHFRGLLLIHAARKWSIEQERFLMTPEVQEALRPLIAEHPVHRGHTDQVREYHLGRGRALALVKLHACVSTSGVFSPDLVPELRAMVDRERTFGDYRPNRWLWVTSDRQRLKPFQVRGHQGFFNVELPEPLTELLA